jgi:hypothetical protein
MSAHSGEFPCCKQGERAREQPDYTVTSTHNVVRKLNRLTGSACSVPGKTLLRKGVSGWRRGMIYICVCVFRKNTHIEVMFVAKQHGIVVPTQPFFGQRAREGSPSVKTQSHASHAAANGVNRHRAEAPKNTLFGNAHLSEDPDRRGDRQHTCVHSSPRSHSGHGRLQGDSATAARPKVVVLATPWSP